MAALGPADFRIDSASAHGPHVLSAVRSEGNNGANRGSYRSTMVEVPESTELIDLVMKSNIGAWGSGGYGNGRGCNLTAQARPGQAQSPTDDREHLRRVRALQGQPGASVAQNRKK